MLIHISIFLEILVVVQSLCGGKFDPHYFTRYLKEKYTALYQL